ncbi:MAG: hypothetical protein WCO49_20110 [Nostocales cyanobacterium ELA608]
MATPTLQYKTRRQTKWRKELLVAEVERQVQERLRVMVDEQTHMVGKSKIFIVFVI